MQSNGVKWPLRILKTFRPPPRLRHNGRANVSCYITGSAECNIGACQNRIAVCSNQPRFSPGGTSSLKSSRYEQQDWAILEDKTTNDQDGRTCRQTDEAEARDDQQLRSFKALLIAYRFFFFFLLNKLTIIIRLVLFLCVTQSFRFSMLFTKFNIYLLMHCFL